MGIISCLLIGMFIGWLNAAINEVDEGIFARMGIGAVGGLFGGLLSSILTENGSMMIGFHLLNILACVLGALLLLTVVSRLKNVVDASNRDLA